MILKENIWSRIHTPFRSSSDKVLVRADDQHRELLAPGVMSTPGTESLTTVPTNVVGTACSRKGRTFDWII